MTGRGFTIFSGLSFGNGIQLALLKIGLDENPVTKVIQQVGGPVLWKTDSGNRGNTP